MSSNTKTTAPKEDAMPALVPKLRFPEFRLAKGWTGEKLGAKTKKVGSGITPTGGDKNYKQLGRPFVRSQNIGWGELLLDDVAFIDEETHNSFSSTQIAILDVLLNITGASIGRSAVADSRIKGGNVNQHVCIIRVKPDELSPSFLNQYLISHDGQKQIDSFQAGGNRQGLNFEQIRSFLIPLPAVFAEQQKIAECLSSVDELIAAQARKVDALKTHKKGLMQQLFPREGETQPRLRFPEFQGAGEWVTNSFGRVLRIGSGKGFKASEYSKTGIRLLQIENVGYGATKWSENTVCLPESYATEYPELVLRGGDIVLALNRPVTNDELKIAKIQENEPIAILYQRVGRLEILDDSLFVDFAFHVCRLFIKGFVVDKSIGSDQPFISLRDLYSQNIRLPALPEQQRIANCLTSLDDLITAQTQKLAALKTHKQGLMQQLFPALEEVEA